VLRLAPDLSSSGWLRTGACPIYTWRAGEVALHADHDMRLHCSALFALLSLACTLVHAKSLSVKLPDATYTGFHNSTSGLDVWLGLRYAAAPVGDLRWRTAQTVAKGNVAVNATTMPLQCVQSVVSIPAPINSNVPNWDLRPLRTLRTPARTACTLISTHHPGRRTFPYLCG
jgi:hypothetical protein